MLRKVVGLIFALSLGLLAQNPKTAKWPSTNAADADLPPAVNFASNVCTLNGGINNSVTTIPINTGCNLIGPISVTIESEIIFCTTFGSNQLSVCTRASESTTAASHADTTKVYGTLTAGAWNQAMAEIIAIEANAMKGVASAVDSEVVLYSGTGGKASKRASATGIAKLTSGVLSAVTAPSGTIVGDSDTQTLTAKTLTTPKITTINDANGNAFIASSATSSAVDSVTITNAATANPATVTIGATGSDSNINLALVAKGTGFVSINGSQMYWVKTSIGEASLTAAATTQNITLFDVPANGTVTAVRIKESTIFSGGSSTALTVSVGRSGTETEYAPAWSLMTTVSATNMYNDGGSWAPTTSSHTLVAKFTGTGANVSTFTAGAVDIWVRVEVLP